MSLVVDEHREYLSDAARLRAFEQAILEAITPRDVVLDLGSGTGILGLLACRAGARKVYSVEATGMVELARAVCKANGFEDRMTLLFGHSTRLELPEKADVVVADQIGRFGFEAGVVEYFMDARRRLLKPGARMIPSSIELFLAPVACPAVFKQIEFWKSRPARFDFLPARTWAANTGYPVNLQPAQLLGDPASGVVIDLATITADRLKFECTLKVRRRGTLHGIGGWFNAQLSKHVTMTNSPLAPQRINRRNVFFPIDSPTPVKKGDVVRVRMQILPTRVLVVWDVEVIGPNGTKAEFRHTTFKGMLLCQEELTRTLPSYKPELILWGKARLTLLTLCDGKHSVAEIEKKLLRLYPELFRSLPEAAEFAAEVITYYTT